jgi:hypothetical protein
MGSTFTIFDSFPEVIFVLSTMASKSSSQDDLVISHDPEHVRDVAS